MLMAAYAEYLTEGSSATVGVALARAKQQYQRIDRPLNYYDEKVLIETVLYGLPMLALQTPANTAASVQATYLHPPAAESERTARIAPDPGKEAEAQAAGADFVVDRTLADNLSATLIAYTLPAVTAHTTDQGVYYDLAGLTIAKPGEPIQPKFWDDVASWSGPAHGALLLSATYRDEQDFDLVVVAPGYLQASAPAVEPVFVSPSFYPALPYNLNTRQTLDGANEATLVVSVGQYDASTGVERLYEELTVDIYHSPVADETPPEFGAVTYQVVSNTIWISATVSDTSGVQRVIATYTNGAGADGHGRWQSVDLAPDAQGAWAGDIPLASPTWFFVQAVDVAGNVAADANAVRAGQSASNNDSGHYYAYLESLPDMAGGLAQGGGVTLSWTHLGAIMDHYEVWRSTQPHFAPGDASSTKLADVPPPAGSTASYTDVNPPSGVAAFYLVRAVCLRLGNCVTSVTGNTPTRNLPGSRRLRPTAATDRDHAGSPSSRTRGETPSRRC